jgi:hypothetical protein
MSRLARTRGALLWTAGILWLAVAASGVVIDTGDGSGNLTVPADDPGFANVGWSSNSLTGVYLRDRWVLTANHVGEPTAFHFSGISYPTVPGSHVRFETSPGVGADLALVRLVSDPPLPPVVLATSGPDVGDVVTLIGNGRLRELAPTCWNSVFTPVSCGMGPPPAFRGYETQDARLIRWGRNQVTVVGSEVTLPGSGTSLSFSTRFDESGVPDEAQLARGDSGGAAFLKRGSQWQLVGILFAQTVEFGQPADAAVFGNDSLIVDVAFYEHQIDLLVNPPFLIPAAPVGLLGLGGVSLAALARRSMRRARLG